MLDQSSLQSNHYLKRGLSSLLLALLLVLVSSSAWATTGGELSIEPSITVGTDPNNCGEKDSITVEAGTHVYFCYSLTNTGTNTLRWHDLEDDYFGKWFDKYHYELHPHQMTQFISDAVVAEYDFSITANWSSQSHIYGDSVQVADSAHVKIKDNKKPATVTVAHFASFADTADGTSVTVRVNGADAITEFTFTDIINDIELPAGDYLIEVLPTGSDTVAISADVTLEAGVDYTLAAIGDGNNQPLELFALVDDNMPVDDAAKIRIAHLAPFADTLDGTKVNVCTDDGTAILEGVPYKTFTDPYLELPAGDYDLKIVAAANGCGEAAIDLPAVTLEAGQIYDVFAIGDGVNQALQIATTSGLTLVETSPSEMATVTIAHYAPFANGASGTSVTIKFYDVGIIEGVKFGDVQEDIAVPAGRYLIEVVPTGTNTVAISNTVTIESGVDYTVVALGNGAYQPLELLVLVDDNEPSIDSAKVRIGHLAAFAAAFDDTQIDICTEENVALLSGVSYKTITDPYVELLAGDYDLKIALSGTDCVTTAIDLPEMTLSAGQIVSVFAIGDSVNQDIGVVMGSNIFAETVSGTEMNATLYMPLVAR